MFVLSNLDEIQASAYLKSHGAKASTESLMGSGAHQTTHTGARIQKPDRFLLGMGSCLGGCPVLGGQGLSRWWRQWKLTARGWVGIATSRRDPGRSFLRSDRGP